MKVVIGADPCGYTLKENIREYLLDNGYEVEDVGTKSPEDGIPYMDVADRVAKAIQSGAAERGLIFCGTGMGVSIAANKHKGVYCALVESQWAAYNCRFINNANVLAIGERIIAPVMARDMVQTFLATAFHQDAAPERAAGLKKLFQQLQDAEEGWF